MTAIELFETMMAKSKEIAPDKEFDKLHKAMLMECCENIIEGTQEKGLSADVMMLSALSAFEVCRSLMKGMIKGLIPAMADTVTINYRNDTFIFDRNSPFIN